MNGMIDTKRLPGNYYINQRTSQGNRDHQEDWSDVVHLDDGHLLIVADGLGGHSDGDWASKEFTNIFIEQFRVQLKGELNIRKCLENTLHLSNHFFKQEIFAQKKGYDAATTLVAAYVKNNHFTYVSMGDSILWLIDNAKQKVVLTSELQESPGGSITSCSGVYFTGGTYGAGAFPVNHSLVLATDGIEPLDAIADRVARVASESPPEIVANELVQETLMLCVANQDNITVVSITRTNEQTI